MGLFCGSMKSQQEVEMKKLACRTTLNALMTLSLALSSAIFSYFNPCLGGDGGGPQDIWTVAAADGSTKPSGGGDGTEPRGHGKGGNGAPSGGDGTGPRKS